MAGHDDDGRTSDITGIIVTPSARSGPEAPPAFVEATFEVMSGPTGTQGAVFPVTGAQTVIGRDDDATIRVDDAVMSRRHALVTYEQNEFRVQDLDSANGTFLNGSRVKEYALRSGDKLLVGETLLRFSVRTRV